MTKEALGYYWEATFDDNSVLVQFDEKGDEILFKKVLDNMDALETFSVVNLDDENEVYTVDLVNKSIIGPNISYNITGSSPELIYFRRNSVRMELGSNKVIDPLVVHHLGIKTSTQEKKLEIFKGLGQRPKKIDFNDVKKKVKKDITKDVK
jgi:hypothetical protein